MPLKDKLKTLSKVTERLTKWESSGKAFGYFTGIKTCEDKIYEFYIYLRILKDLETHYVITYISNGKNTFPGAPALKANYSYFEATHKTKPNNSYQICYGTKIQLSYAPETMPAPDISIQKILSPLTPTEKDILIVMDSKYKYDKMKSISIAQIEAFMMKVVSLELSNAKYTDIDFGKLVDFKANCIITNGNVLSSHEKYCSKFHLRQIGQFWATQKIIVIS